MSIDPTLLYEDFKRILKNYNFKTAEIEKIKDTIGHWKIMENNTMGEILDMLHMTNTPSIKRFNMTCASKIKSIMLKIKIDNWKINDVAKYEFTINDIDSIPGLEEHLLDSADDRCERTKLNDSPHITKISTNLPQVNSETTMFLSTSFSGLPPTRIINKSRDEIALHDLTLCFNNKLRAIMKNAAFNFTEREVCHRPFLDFMHFTLLHLGQNVRDIKYKLSLELSEEENICLTKLECKIFDNQGKMNKAIELMKKDLQPILKDYMIQSGFELYETEQSHTSYLSLVSSFIVLESEKMFRYKDRFMPSKDDKHANEDKIDSISSPPYD